MIVDKKNQWKFKYVLVKEQVWTQKCAVQKASVNINIMIQFYISWEGEGGYDVNLCPWDFFFYKVNNMKYWHSHLPFGQHISVFTLVL
jgi:hypothetical protein